MWRSSVFDPTKKEIERHLKREELLSYRPKPYTNHADDCIRRINDMFDREDAKLRAR